MTLKKIVQRVRSRVQENPDGGPVSSATDLVLELIRSGKIADWDESAIMDAAAEVGLTEDEAVSMMDQLSSYLV